MSFLNMLAAWQWGLLGAVPAAIILLYFLKLKRTPLEVPSTYLWSRTIEDLHVNSIWQRLRRSLLLFLQLLLVVLVMIALLRPGWRGTQLTDERYVFMIDNSASMSATDVESTRLDSAKRRAIELVSQLKAGRVAMVTAFSDTPQIMQTFTASRGKLRRQIKRISSSNRPTDLLEALRAASGLANPGLTRLEDNQAVDESLPATIYILSDGGFRAVTDFSLGNLKPIFLPFGEPDAKNLGIVAFSTDRNPEKPDRMQAFYSVANFGAAEAAVEVEMFLDGESLDVAEMTIPAGEENSWQLDLPDLDEGVLKLVLNHGDALELDNQAYAAINRPRRARVLLVTPGNEPLRTALLTDQARTIADVEVAEPSVLEEKPYQTRAAAGAYDLVIYDRCRPTEPPQANTLFVADLPPGTTWQAKAAEGSPAIIDIDRVHPLTQMVQMNNVVIAEGVELTPPPGSTVLFDSVIGPLLAIGPRDGFEDAVLGFSLLDIEDAEIVPNTTWPLRPSFPVFVYNALRYLGGSRGSLAVTSIAPGSPVTLRSPAHIDQITVLSPDGARQQMRRTGQNAFVFTETEQVGVYEVFEGPQREIAQRFVVNLFDLQESNIRPRKSIELGHETVPSVTRAEPVRRELWKWIVILGIAVLAFEWYIYNRRVFL